jgi:hypothetical protein
MMTALKPAEAEFVRSRAEKADATFSDVIAALVRIGIEHVDEMPPSLQPKEVLPESA